MIALVSLAGCQPSARDPYAPFIVTPQYISTEVVGYSVQNRPVELVTCGSGPETVLIIATIHGNEDAGTPLVFELIHKLRRSQDILQSHTVLIVPVANPDGLANCTRGNTNGIDLNRNFPTSNRINNAVHGHSGLTEPESQILYNLILLYQPVRIVSIHQPLNCLDYDGPAGEIAQNMSYYCPLPVKKLGSRPGSLGSFAGVEKNIPIITMELIAEDSNSTATQLWTRYGYALLAAITYPEAPY